MRNHRRRAVAAGPAALAAVVGAIVVVALSGGGSHNRPPPGFVYREGNRLYLDGRPYRFVGVNLPWANDRLPGGCGPPVSVATLDRALDGVSGYANAVRVWFFQSQATAAGHRDWRAFDETLRAIRQHGLKVIVTLADQYGYCHDPGGFKDVAWYEHGYADSAAPGFPQTYRDYARSVVERYRNDPEILAWQLINEPSVVTPGAACGEASAARLLRRWADHVGGMVRSIDPNHLIGLGTGLQGGCGYAVTSDPAHNDYARVYGSPSLDLCEYHDYTPPTEPLPPAELEEMNACAALGKPFFVGELGIPRTDPERPASLAVKLAAEFGYPTEPAQGALVWELGSAAVGACDRYCIELGDPALGVLGRYR